MKLFARETLAAEERARHQRARLFFAREEKLYLLPGLFDVLAKKTHDFGRNLRCLFEHPLACWTNFKARLKTHRADGIA